MVEVVKKHLKIFYAAEPLKNFTHQFPPPGLFSFITSAGLKSGQAVPMVPKFIKNSVYMVRMDLLAVLLSEGAIDLTDRGIRSKKRTARVEENGLNGSQDSGR